MHVTFRFALAVVFGGVVSAFAACNGGGQLGQDDGASNPCDLDAAFSAVNVCLVPASDQQRRGVPITSDCYWLNKAIGMKDLRGINAEALPASYDVYVYNFCNQAANVDLKFPDRSIVCVNEDASGAISLGSIPADAKPRRGTCRTVPYPYVESAPVRRGSYQLTARIGSAVGTYDPEVVLERAGDPPPVLPADRGKPPVPPPGR